MTSSCPLGPSLACSAVGQYWMNSKTWIAGPTHTAPNVTKHWHYLRDYGGMTISTDTKVPGRAQGCHCNGGHTWGERIHFNISAAQIIFWLSAVLNGASTACSQRRNSHDQKRCKDEIAKNYSFLSFCPKSNNPGLLTLSVCWWMEPEWWRSWTEERAGPAGSLCWYRGCPSVSGNAGAGLGLPGHAVRCSAARKGKRKASRG